MLPNSIKSSPVVGDHVRQESNPLCGLKQTPLTCGPVETPADAILLDAQQTYRVVRTRVCLPLWFGRQTLPRNNFWRDSHRSASHSWSAASEVCFLAV